MADYFKEHPYFDCARFEEEVFANDRKDPFHQRMANIRTWGDVREYFGLSAMQCDEHVL